jgi:alkylhydroperoxidase/carboxymuconolactone decarboxylase family protein YurZ
MSNVCNDPTKEHGPTMPDRRQFLAAGPQIPYHLNRAMDNGLTQVQAAEVITHLAFYAGWPNAFSALPVAKVSCRGDR